MEDSNDPYVSHRRCRTCRGSIIFSGEGCWWCVNDLVVTRAIQKLQTNSLGETEAEYSHAPFEEIEPDIVWRWAVRRARRERALVPNFPR